MARLEELSRGAFVKGVREEGMSMSSKPEAWHDQRGEHCFPNRLASSSRWRDYTVIATWRGSSHLTCEANHQQCRN